jgi:hypothetical protein
MFIGIHRNNDGFEKKFIVVDLISFDVCRSSIGGIPTGSVKILLLLVDGTQLNLVTDFEVRGTFGLINALFQVACVAFLPWLYCCPPSASAKALDM